MNNEELKNWLLLAEIDLKTSKELIKSKDSLYISVCFHCQQSVEKYLKSFLIFHNIKPEKSHNIYKILQSCEQVDSEFIYLKNINIDKLTIYAVEIRYPDDFYIPSIEEAKEAIELAEMTKEFVLRKLKERGYKV